MIITIKKILIMKDIPQIYNNNSFNQKIMYISNIF